MLRWLGLVCFLFALFLFKVMEWLHSSRTRTDIYLDPARISKAKRARLVVELTALFPEDTGRILDNKDKLFELPMFQYVSVKEYDNACRALAPLGVKLKTLNSKGGFSVQPVLRAYGGHQMTITNSIPWVTLFFMIIAVALFIIAEFA